MKLEVQLFAGAKEAAGADSITLEVTDGAKAADVIAAIGEAVPAMRDLLPACRLAVDSNYVGPSAVVSSENEIALIPPVSGG